MNLKTVLTIALIGAVAVAGLSFLTPSKKSAATTAIVTPPTATTQQNHPAAKRVKPKKQIAQAIPAGATNAKTKVPSGPKPGSPIEAGDLSWLHIQDAGQLKNKEEKMFFVDVYTDWCGWCKVMDKKTFIDPEVQKLLNENFHVVKFNAEQKEAIQFDGASYEWMRSGRNGVNALAKKFLGSRLSYPSFIYLDKDLKVVKVTRGYKKPDQFLTELKGIIG